MGLKDRGVKDKSFQVIRETKMAVVLLEIGFLSNISD
nr:MULTISPECIES: N-acetylmuramoyl-L-alanine amidase [Paenibacillus]